MQTRRRVRLGHPQELQHEPCQFLSGKNHGFDTLYDLRDLKDAPKGWNVMSTDNLKCVQVKKGNHTMTKARPSIVIQMRQSGASLDQIASRFGISREWVRRLLIKYHGSTRVQELLRAAELARQAGCSQSYIRKLRRRGTIQPAQVVGKGRTHWKPETVDTIVRYRSSQQCRICNRPLPDNHWVYCSRACWIEAYRYNRYYRYDRMSEEEKRLHNERVARWRKNHPEQARDIEQRKQRKYQAKKSRERYESNRYIIWKKCPIPLGTIVKVLGYGTKKGRLKAEWGKQIIEIPLCSVKQIDKQS